LAEELEIQTYKRRLSQFMNILKVQPQGTGSTLKEDIEASEHAAIHFRRLFQDNEFVMSIHNR
jgi:hypothetical protein